MTKSDRDHHDKTERELPAIMATTLIDAVQGQAKRDPRWPRDHTAEIRELLRPVAERARKEPNDEG